MLAVSLVQSKAFVSANPQNCKTGTIPILQVRKLWPIPSHRARIRTRQPGCRSGLSALCPLTSRLLEVLFWPVSRKQSSVQSTVLGFILPSQNAVSRKSGPPGTSTASEPSKWMFQRLRTKGEPSVSPIPTPCLFTLTLTHVCTHMSQQVLSLTFQAHNKVQRREV